MQRKSERQSASDVEHRDELAERRHRAPRPPRFRAERPAARSPDLRLHPPAGVTLGAKHAELIELIDAEIRAGRPRPMWSMFVAARDLADDHASYDAARSPEAALRGAIARCRAGFVEAAEVGDCDDEAQLREFDEAAARLFKLCDVDDDGTAPLTGEQHLLLIASGFAQYDVIAAYLDIGEEALRQRLTRLRAQVPDLEDRAARALPHVVQQALRLTELGLGVDVDGLFEQSLERAGLGDDFQTSDPRFVEAVDSYEHALIECMLARVVSDA